MSVAVLEPPMLAAAKPPAGDWLKPPNSAAKHFYETLSHYSACGAWNRPTRPEEPWPDTYKCPACKTAIGEPI